VGHQPHVHRHVSVKDRVSRLGWWGLWLVAQRSMRLWLADPTYTGSKAVGLSRRDGHLVDESSVWVRTVGIDTTRSGRRSCSHGSS
jgi:hypothetical protein